MGWQDVIVEAADDGARPESASKEWEEKINASSSLHKPASPSVESSLLPPPPPLSLAHFAANEEVRLRDHQRILKTFYLASPLYSRSLSKA